jgi:hypothetical protein
VNTSIETEENASASIPVPILYGNYDHLRLDALTANLLTLSAEKYYDVPGRLLLPYRTRQLFVASPSRNYTRDGSVSLVFKPGLYYSNSGKAISSFQVDFDNGAGYVTAGWNTAVSTSYSTNGTKTLKIRVNFTDASFAECYSVLEVQGAGAGTLRYASPFDDSQLFQDFSTYGGGTALVRYSRQGTERAMTKPLIVVEGFDMSTVAGKLQGNYNQDRFLLDLEDIAGFDFNNALDITAGYDLVFLDFGDGTEDIARNALLLRAVINWVNAQKAAAGSTEQNVILGISMGGLVSRYCLADMTKAGLNPQTRLLITHDSPHRGANLPTGIQFLIKAMAQLPVGIPGLTLRNMNKDLDAAMNVLESPAAGQMLITKANLSYNAFGTPTYAFDANTWLESTYRPKITFQPTDIQPAYQVMATSLGSECGTAVAAPGVPLISMNSNYNQVIIPWILRRGARIEASANALPAFGTSGQVMSFKQIWQYRILGISINITRANLAVNSPANMLPWDGAPGGMQDATAYAGGLPNADFEFGSFLQFSIQSDLGNRFCFVPTVSALDIENVTATTLFSPYNSGFSPGNPARVANYIANFNTFGAVNSPHPTFTDRNSQWMYNNMENLPNGTVGCNTGCRPNQGIILGDFATNACLGATANFSIRGFPPGSTYNWTSPAGLTISGQGTSQITATRTGGFLTELNLEVATPCGTFDYQRIIPALTVDNLSGTVYYTDRTSGMTEQIPASSVNGVCPQGEVLLTPDITATVTNVTQTNGNFTSTWWFDSGGIHFFSDFLNFDQWPSFEVTYNYGCGSTVNTFHFWEANCMSPFMISPNPASTQLTIKAPTPMQSMTTPPPPGARMSKAPQKANKPATAPLIHQLAMIDISGKEVVRKVIAPASTYTFDVAAMPAGMYIVRIYDGKQWHSQKVIVQ